MAYNPEIIETWLTYDGSSQMEYQLMLSPEQEKELRIKWNDLMSEYQRLQVL